jgi:hypothetical protein
MFKRKNKIYVKRGQFDFSQKDFILDYEKELEQTKELESPKEMLLEEFSDDVLYHWQAPEFEILERDKKGYILAALALFAIIAYAVYRNDLIMAITFMLIGMVGYIYVNKEPRVLDFLITKEGVVAGREMYTFKNIKSFWIFYQPGKKFLGLISLHIEAALTPYVHIPFDDEKSEEVREILSRYIPEEEHEPGWAETFGRFLKI